MPAPANDLCAGATTIAALPYSETGVDNTDATETAGDPVVVDAGPGTVAGATTLFKTQFWTYTPASDQTVLVSADTVGVSVAVFTGSCGSLTEVASYTRKLTARLTAGVTYTIMTGNYANVGKTFDFSVATTTAPYHQYQSTAIDITNLLPYTATVDLSGVSQSFSGDKAVYYSYTGEAGDLMIGFFAYGATSDATVRYYEYPYDIYDDNAAEPNVFTSNLPMQYPVGDRTLIIRVSQSSGGAGSVAIDVQPGPTSAAPTGSIIDTDDTPGFPAAVISRSTGTILRFVDLPAGEWGDVLTDGTFMLDSADTDDAVFIYSRSYALVSNLGTLGSANDNQSRIRISPGLQEFFVGRSGGGGPMASIRRVEPDGTVVTTWTLPASGLTALAPNNDGSIVYVSGQTSSTNTPVKRWLTGSSAFGTDLAAGLGANERVWDMLVLSDDTVVVSWMNTSTGTVTVKRLTDSGSVLGTYTKSGMSQTFGARLAYDPASNETHFWVWTHTTTGHSVFERVSAAMTVVETVPNVREYESGVYTGAETATPDARFGCSQSCPFFFTRGAIVVPPPSELCCPCDCPEPRGPGGTPSSGPIPTHTGPILPPVLPEWIPACTGGGDVPTAADATDAESWVS